MDMRGDILRFGPWAVPVLVLLSGLAAESPAPLRASRYEALLAEIRPKIASVDAQELAARLARGGVHLIDVREDSEWEAGRLPGARHLSKGLIERDIEKLIPDPAAEIVLYCAGGGRSLLAAENLRRMGYTKVFSLEGGYRAWLEARGP